MATFSNEDHPLTTEKEDVQARGGRHHHHRPRSRRCLQLLGLKESERLVAALREDGKEVVPYLVGRKAIGFYKFRHREYAAEWSGFSEQPDASRPPGDRRAARRGLPQGLTEEGGIDEVHVVFTRFVSMVTQEPEVIRLLPLEVVERAARRPDADDLLPLYEFEPSAEQVLDALLPKYVTARLFNCMLQAAASELAARQRAMKSATDNAEELIKKYTRLANQARQAEITQEISEIVGGAERAGRRVSSE